jgi:hypothetical protein
MRRQIDNEMLEMALAGFRAKREEIRQAMAAIEQQLGRHKGSATTVAPVGEPGARPKRKLSAAGKRAIQAAVKRRWAAFHAKAGGSKPASAKKSAKPKRTLSPAAKARLAANLAKARAAKASKRAASVS